MGALDLSAKNDPSDIASRPSDSSTLESTTTADPPYPTPLSPESLSDPLMSRTTCLVDQPLINNLLQQPPSGPSPEYLQSLLHVNEALLAQSLSQSSSSIAATNENANDTTVTATTTTILSSPPTTPEEIQVMRKKGLSRSNSASAKSIVILKPPRTRSTTTTTGNHPPAA